MQMTVGNAEYQCSCVRYVAKDGTTLIVALSAGLVVPFIIIIISVVVVVNVVYRRRLSAEQRRNPGYSRRLPDADSVYTYASFDEKYERPGHMFRTNRLRHMHTYYNARDFSRDTQ